MTHYRLYHITRSTLVGVDDFEAENDLRAELLSKPLHREGASELWAEHRKIKSFAPHAS